MKRDAFALFLAARHPDTPWYAKALAAGVAAYAFSPIDLIPDFVPVLGYLDDLVLIPLGVAAAVRLIPAPVLAECRVRASEEAAKPVSRIAGIVVAIIWLLTFALFAAWVFGRPLRS